MLDLRTQEGRYARDICDGIAADLGGAPNAAQQLLFQISVLRSSPEVPNVRSASCPLDHYPRVMRVYDNCMAIPAFADAHPAKQPDAE